MPAFPNNHLRASLVALLLATAPVLAGEAAAPIEIDDHDGGAWNAVLSFLEYPLYFFLPHYERRKRVFALETEYHAVTVEDDESGRRHLVFRPGKGSQSIYCLEDPDQIISNYMRHALGLALMAVPDDPERVLFIGMGGGIMPSFLRRTFPEAEIDIVELDGEIPEIAERFFGFKKDAKTRIVIRDARVFVNQSDDLYDLVFIDAYNGDYIPFHLTTVEFFQAVRDLLAPAGAVAVNIANFDNHQFIKREFKTLDHVFTALEVFVCPRETNFVPIAGKTIDLDADTLRRRGGELRRSRAEFNFDVDAMLGRRMSEEKWNRFLGNAEILTDDHAPVSLLR